MRSYKYFSSVFCSRTPEVFLECVCIFLRPFLPQETTSAAIDGLKYALLPDLNFTNVAAFIAYSCKLRLCYNNKRFYKCMVFNASYLRIKHGDPSHFLWPL